MAKIFKRNNSFGYVMMEKEDPQEKKQREAQFLIYKTLKRADHMAMRRSSRPCWLKLRICKLKVKIGKRLLKLRKTMMSNMVKTKMDVYKHVMVQLKNFKRLFRAGSGGLEGDAATAAANGTLPQPLLT